MLELQLVLYIIIITTTTQQLCGNGFIVVSFLWAPPHLDSYLFLPTPVPKLSVRFPRKLLDSSPGQVHSGAGLVEHSLCSRA